MRLLFLNLRFGGLLVAVLAAGCGGSGPSHPAGLSGTIVIDGSSTVFRISRAAQISYTREFGDDVKVLVNNSGTGGGFGRYLRGEIDIIDASRPAHPEEESEAREKGLDWTRFVVGYDGVTVAVNPQNTFCNALSVAQLREIFRPGSPVTTWKDIDPRWPARKIVFYTPDNDSGTFEFFTEKITEKDAQRKDIQASSDDNTLVTGISRDVGGLGYFGYAYYAAYSDLLKAVAIQNGPDAPAVPPNRETILDESYQPLSRPLLLYVKNTAMERPEVLDFLRYYLMNIDTMATAAGYVPPTPADQRENLEKISAMLPATTGSESPPGDSADPPAPANP